MGQFHRCLAEDWGKCFRTVGWPETFCDVEKKKRKKAKQAKSVECLSKRTNSLESSCPRDILHNLKELIPFATAWMELESIMLSEISQTVRDKYHMITSLTGT